MSAPRTKRQFAGAASHSSQRQITSFFNSSTTSTATVLSSSSTSPSDNLSSSTLSSSATSQASLPGSVQANLLSVGMRIRKSVPEGYKTGTYSSFGIWDEGSKLKISDNSTTSMAVTEGRSRANAFSSPRELLPFCGINKVGGMDMQPTHDKSSAFSANSMPPYQLHPRNDDLVLVDSVEEDDVPGLSSSQETVESVDSHNHDSTSSARPRLNLSPSGYLGRKRSYTEEEETLEIPSRLYINHPDTAVSPRSLAPVGWGSHGNHYNGRLMAVPRKGRFRQGTSPNSHASSEDCFGFGPASLPGSGARTHEQENVVVAADFEEADFLDGGVGDSAMDMSDL